MRMSITTWDGTAINDVTNYVATAPIGMGNGMASATPNYIDMGQGDPVLGGKTLTGTLFTFQVQLKGSTDATREAQRDTLTALFVPNDFTLRKLYATDLDDSNRVWYLEGFTVSPPMLAEGALNLYNITIALTSPYWIEYVENEVVWDVTADTETQEVTNRGNVTALPIFEIKPELNKSSNTLTSQTFVGIHNSADWEPYLRSILPIDLTPAGVDTATPILAGDMQADGNDIRVTVNGTVVPRYLVDIDTATTHIWANIALTRTPDLDLVTVLNNSTLPATIVCTFTESSISLPQNSMFQIGTEFFTYSTLAIDTVNKTVTFTMVSRGAKGSTMAAHSAGAAVYWIEYDIWITYGDASATAPVYYVYETPVMDLTQSSNSIWVYPTFSTMLTFRGYDAPRFGGAAEKFTSEDKVVSGIVDPFEVLGIEIHSVLIANIVYRLNVWGALWFTHPGKFNRAVIAAEKWRNTADWGRFEVNVAGTIHTEPTPTVVDTWEVVSLDITGSQPNQLVAIYNRGMLGTTIPVPVTRIQVFSATLYIAYPPTITLSVPAATVYKLSPTIVNEETDHGFQLLDISTEVNEVTTVDCGEMEAYKEDGTRVRGQLAFTGEQRDEWMTLLPGANTIRYTDVGTTGVEVTIRWRARNTI